jgi:peptidoglycan/LPS O-acetylase OafA/YrhL
LLDYFSIWPFFVEIGVLLALVATSLFAAADAPPIPATDRIDTFDGLRGFLALSVFFHHAAAYHDYLQTGTWKSPASHFYLHVGPAGVAVFFMITGFLFYTQLLKVHGKPNWKKLYMGRAFRILPLYWFAVALVFIGVMIHTQGRLAVPPIQLFLEMVRWSLGALFPEAPINGSAFATQITLDVTWTLRYEWFFYFSLVLIALATRWRWGRFLLPPVVLCVALLHEVLGLQGPGPWICVALFGVGMSVAAVRCAWPQAVARGPVASIAAAIFWLATILVARDVVFRPVPVLCLGAFFLLIGLGTDLFGLLRTRPARRLGNISYGIYLLQGAVFAAASSFAPVRALALQSPLGHWAVALVEGIALVVLATLTHRLIERPGIELGRRLAAAESTPRKAVSEA